MSKMILYLKEAFSELLNKVTWPSWDDLQNSSIVVAIATLIIALVIYLLDTTFSNLLDLYYSFCIVMSTEIKQNNWYVLRVMGGKRERQLRQLKKRLKLMV